MDLRTSEQAFARVQLGVVDDRLEEPLQDAADPRSRLESDLDQLVATDGQVTEAMRARLLRLEQGRECVQLRGRPALRFQVGAAVRDEIKGEPVAVSEQGTPRLAGRARQVLGSERVLADDRDDPPREPVRVA